MALFSPARCAPVPVALARFGGRGGAAAPLPPEAWPPASAPRAATTVGGAASATWPGCPAPSLRRRTVWPPSCATSTSRPPGARPANNGWPGCTRRGTCSTTSAGCCAPAPASSPGSRAAARARGESPHGVLSKRHGAASSARGPRGSGRAEQTCAVQAPTLQVWASRGDSARSSLEDTSRNVFLTVTLRSSPASEVASLEPPERRPAAARRAAGRPGPSSAASGGSRREPRRTMGRVVGGSGMGSSLGAGCGFRCGGPR
mmetsp:Transcript_80652/g.218439  ORF Transcript_80652/g.218439 Transcript_80652/m.218439 type:complete len:260 (-) Transcript_80652:24-803(-)